MHAAGGGLLASREGVGEVLSLAGLKSASGPTEEHSGERSGVRGPKKRKRPERQRPPAVPSISHVALPDGR